MLESSIIFCKYTNPKESHCTAEMENKLEQESKIALQMLMMKSN